MDDHKPCGFVREVHWNLFYKGQAGVKKRSWTWVRIDFPNCGMRCCCSVAELCLLFATPWTAACQVSLSVTISLCLLKLMSFELVMPSNHVILCCLLLFLPSIFPGVRVFSNEPALQIRRPKYWSWLEIKLHHLNLSLSPTYLQNRNRLTDFKNKLVVTKRETWQVGIN